MPSTMVQDHDPKKQLRAICERNMVGPRLPVLVVDEDMRMETKGYIQLEREQRHQQRRQAQACHHHLGERRIGKAHDSHPGACGGQEAAAEAQRRMPVVDGPRGICMQPLTSRPACWGRPGT